MSTAMTPTSPETPGGASPAGTSGGASGGASGAPRVVGPLSLGIVVFTLVTAALHVYLGFPPRELIHLLFIAHGLGSLFFLALLYAPLPFLPRGRPGIRGVFAAYNVGGIVAYLVAEQGTYSGLGWTAKAAETIVLVLLIVEGHRVNPSPPFGVRPVEHTGA